MTLPMLLQALDAALPAGDDRGQMLLVSRTGTAGQLLQSHHDRAGIAGKLLKPGPGGSHEESGGEELTELGVDILSRRLPLRRRLLLPRLADFHERLKQRTDQVRDFGRGGGQTQSAGSQTVSKLRLTARQRLAG